MKVAGIREFRSKIGSLLRSGEPLLVTKHGKISGMYLPLEEPDKLPDDLRSELAKVLGQYFSSLLREQGVTEERVAEDFGAYRRSRR